LEIKKKELSAKSDKRVGRASAYTKDKSCLNGQSVKRKVKRIRGGGEARSIRSTYVEETKKQNKEGRKREKSTWDKVSLKEPTEKKKYSASSKDDTRRGEG